MAIESIVGGRGATAGLDTYERWLNGRTVEEPGVLGRIGRGVLFEWARQTGDRTARLEALQALATEGVPEAMSALTAAANAGGAGESRVLVALGDAAAIDRVLNRLKTATGIKQTEINVLAESKSPRVVQPLVDLLADRDNTNRAAAADALGKVGRREAVPALKALFDSSTGLVHLAAAGALVQLGDTSGLVEILNLAKSEHAAIRMSAAVLLSSRPDGEWMALVRGLAADSDPSYRLRAAKLLMPHEEDFARSVLDNLLLDPNPEIRESAGVLLAHDTLRADYPMLRQLLRAPSSRIRVAAAARLMANVR